MNTPKRLPEPNFPDNLNTEVYHEAGIHFSTANQYVRDRNILSSQITTPIQTSLDVCGGSGDFAHMIHSLYGAKATVLDGSKTALKQLDEKFPGDSVTGLLKSAYDIIHTPEMKGAFDLVSCIDALHELDIDKAIENMSFATKRNGYVYIYDFNRDFLAHPIHSSDNYFQQLSQAREKRTEEEFVEQFMFIFNKLPSRKDLYWFSFQASYTSEEVINEFEKNNISLLYSKDSIRGTSYLGQKN